jgi:CRP-like cAMP-binding protein
MALKRRPSFDPKSFLAMVGEGRGIGEYHKDQIVFSQGDPADAVFYIQSGKVKVTVVSEQGKDAVVAMERTNSSVKDVHYRKLHAMDSSLCDIMPRPPRLGIARVMRLRAMPFNTKHLFLISPQLGNQFILISILMPRARLAGSVRFFGRDSVFVSI